MKNQNSFLKTIFSITLMAAFAITAVAMAASPASAQTDSTDSIAQGKAAGVILLPPPTALFSISHIKGTYGWNSVAFVNSSTSQPAAGAGLMTFDGQGNLYGHYSGNYLGTPITQDYKGTYSVNPDGSGHLHFDQQNGASLDYDLFIVSGGNEIFLVSTAVGTLQVVDVKKQ